MKVESRKSKVENAVAAASMCRRVFPFLLLITGHWSLVTHAQAQALRVFDRLDKQLDVTIASPANGNVLIYNGSKWINATPASPTTSTVAEGSNLYFTNARAIAAPLTGFTSGAGTVASSDSILTAFQKLDGNIAANTTAIALKAPLASPTFTGTVGLPANTALTTPKITTGINDANGNELWKYTATTSAVNELTLANAATGASPSITASGDDANVGISFSTKGTGAAPIVFNVAGGNTDGSAVVIKRSVSGQSGSSLLSVQTSQGTVRFSVSDTGMMNLAGFLTGGGGNGVSVNYNNNGELEVFNAGKIGFSTTSSAGGTMGVRWSNGTGSPEGAVTAPIGSLYSRTDGGASTTLYVKESGSGNTGWVAK